jgi:hypothetical protein
LGRRLAPMVWEDTGGGDWDGGVDWLDDDGVVDRGIKKGWPKRCLSLERGPFLRASSSLRSG